MDNRKSKTSRSYGEGSKYSRDSSALQLEAKPQVKERVKSAPILSSQAKHGNDVRHKYMTSSTRRVSASTTFGIDSSRPPSPTWSSAGNSSMTMEQTMGTSSSPNDHCHDSAVDAGTSRSIQTQLCGDEQPREITVAVLGEPNTGKSTFIQCALDLKRQMTSPSATKKVSLEGEVSTLRLLEVPISDLQISDEDGLRMPIKVGGQEVFHVDGALLIFDVMNKATTECIPKLLAAFDQNDLPAVLVYSKCDNPQKSWHVTPEMTETLCLAREGTEAFQTSASATETHKRCISIILRNVLAKKENGQRVHALRPRVMTSVVNNNSDTQPPSTRNGRSRQIRAASEKPNVGWASKTQSASSVDAIGSHGRNFHKASPSQAASCTSKADFAEDPASSGIVNEDKVDESIQRGEEPHKPNGDPSRKPPVADPRNLVETADTFLNMDEDRHNHVFEEDRSHRHSLETDNTSKLVLSDEAGLPFVALVDRLILQNPQSDGKFTAIFLCFYRKFAPPSDLILALTSRFDCLGHRENLQATRVSSQLRCLSIFSQWMSEYPGDFAHPHTRQLMNNFVNGIMSSRHFSTAAKEVASQLEIVTEDDDTEWACSDMSRARSNTTESFLSNSSTQSAAPTLNADSSTEDVRNGSTVTRTFSQHTPRHSATSSMSSNTGRSGSQSTASFQTLLNSVEDAQRYARSLVPNPHYPLNKVQWHQFMETSEEDVAKEMTRIDWIMFSSIRPRDLVRHVSLQPIEKRKCKQLENVNRMINHFNHVALWVANLILLRDKPKHRAKTLERFMSIAWKLRQLNNYNSLGAVVAGINGTAIHRLSQTRDLISINVQKQFMRLEILMGTQKSHFAYRLAWSNTSTERIPFLPLHRRDLVAAEEGNRTFVDDNRSRINWKKFEIMGEVITGIQRSQSTPYANIHRHEDIQKLILDITICKDEDGLYERSLQLESAGAGETARKIASFLTFKR